MREESPESKIPLRSGYTTGACATATSLAAATLLLDNQALTEIDIRLPRGEVSRFQIGKCRLGSNKNEAVCSTIKDAGDDPDVTHCAEIIATVELTTTVGVLFVAGQGVGRVTKAGLALAIGEAAINPVPRNMIESHLIELAQRTHYNGGFSVTIAITNGLELAK